MGNTENFELYETSSKRQCPDCALYLEADVIFCTCVQCMQPTERNRQMNKERFAVLSNPGYIIKKNLSYGVRRGPSVRQTMYFKAHDLLRKARSNKNGNSKTILHRWHDDDKYRKSLSDIGWIEEQTIQYDAIVLEDRSYVASWQERSRNEKSWKISLNAEGIQGPLKKRSDYTEAKQKCKILYDEHTAITGDENKTIPPRQQVRPRLDQQFEGLEEYDYRLEARTGWRYYHSSRTTHSSSSSHWQPSSDQKSTWSWDS